VSAQFPEAHALPGTSSTGQAGERPLNRLLERLTEVAQGQRGRFALHVQRGTLGLTLLAVILGVYLAAQWQSRPRPAAGAPEYRREIAAQTIQRLEIEQADLKRQIAEMRAELANRQRDAAAGQSDLTHLSADLAEEKLAAGTVPVRGPGVRILLDDSAVKTIPPKEDPAMYIVHEYQLRDVVNLLWSAGAEAISINGERMVAPSSIYCVGSTILVNDTRTSPPYEFLVIGDASKLEAVVGDASNLRALKSRIRLYGLQFATQKTKDIVVPAYDGSLDVRHVLLTEPLSTRGGGR
jgi:uncharacterized protein YlxW (UPF0749 family)